jgi:hypothetical protein
MAGKNATENTRKHSNFKDSATMAPLKPVQCFEFRKLVARSFLLRPGTGRGPSEGAALGYDGWALEAALATLRSKCGIGGNGQGRRGGRRGRFQSGCSCTSNGRSGLPGQALLQGRWPARGRGYTSIWCANAGKVLGNS